MDMDIRIVQRVNNVDLIQPLHYNFVENIQIRGVIYLIEKEKLCGATKIIKYQGKLLHLK